jgi:ribosomal protein S27AE
MSDDRPRPRYIDATCPRCGAHLAPEHASDPGCHRWVCSELCSETIHVDSWMWPRSYVRRDVKAEAYEEDGLLIEEHGDECD